MISLPKNPVLGTGPVDDLFGLYSNHHDRILITYFHLPSLKILTKCLSSKINLELLHINACTAWQQNLIDNSVCLNWGIAHLNTRHNLDSILYNQECIVPEHLIDFNGYPRSLSRVADLATTMLWFIEGIVPTKKMARQALKASLSQQATEILQFFDDNLSSDLKVTIDNGFQDLEHQIARFESQLLHMFYWCRDAQDLVSTVEQYLSQDSLMSNLYRKQCLHKSKQT